MATDTISLDRIAEAIDLPALIGREGIELRNGKGFCPFHMNTNTPALSVFRSENRWRYRCHGCEESGDAISWVATRQGISTVEAARLLAQESGHHVGAPASAPRVVERPAPVEVWRDPEWQEVVEGLIVEAESRLWGREGRDALAWLRARGLADVTISRFRLGFFAEARSSRPVGILRGRDGGRGIYAPRGITLPWLAPGACYRETLEGDESRPRWVGCNVRRLADPDVFAPLPAEVEKCMAMRGSSRGYLFPWPDIISLPTAQPLLLVEGEWDALICQQEVGHLIPVATAGSASVRSLPLATRSRLALSSWLLLAFHHDAAGVAAAWKWREKYPQKSRPILPPSVDDLNDFFLAGGDLASWVRGFPEFRD